jgi:hypothetical protein
VGEKVKTLGTSLRGITPVYLAEKAGLVQLVALNSLQSNFLKQRFTNKLLEY